MIAMALCCNPRLIFADEPTTALGLVGESGCGKTTVGRSILQLTKPTGGNVIFKGEDLGRLNKEKLRQVRTSLQIIFQDPFSSLNPRMSVEQIITEPVKNFNKLRVKVAMGPCHTSVSMLSTLLPRL